MAHNANRKKLTYDDYTVGIVCPLEVEMTALRCMLDEEHMRLPRKDGDHNRYILGRIGHHNLAIGYLPHGSKGIGAAATVATDMKRSFSFVRLRMLVGIGGGIPSQKNDIRLGDVVVGMPDGIHGGVVQYDLGKRTVDGFERTGFLCPLPDEWRTAVVEMQSDHKMNSMRFAKFMEQTLQASPTLQEHYPRPPAALDNLFPPHIQHFQGESTCDRCGEGRAALSGTLIGPKIFYGTIASGNSVIKDAEVREQISKASGGALCFEMEAAGLANSFPCVVVRGICNYADSHKNDLWHPYAAATAAACAKELLTYMDPVPVAKSAQARSHFLVPRRRVKNFFGREEELQQIRSYFKDEVDRPRAMVLHALGGQGKSQIALEYCQQARKIYRGVFWINASSESSLTHDLLSVAHEVNPAATEALADDDSKVSFILRTLEEWEDRWLMVLDNYDDPAAFSDVEHFIPQGGKGDVLFTTRHRDLGELGLIVTVPPMPEKAAVELLLHRYTGIDVNDHMSAGISSVRRLEV